MQLQPVSVRTNGPKPEAVLRLTVLHAVTNFNAGQAHCNPLDRTIFALLRKGAVGRGEGNLDAYHFISQRLRCYHLTNSCIHGVSSDCWKPTWLSTETRSGLIVVYSSSMVIRSRY
jgi:hypothetical protein